MWTKDEIAFARVGQNIQLDRIPLAEVLLVRSMEHEQKEIPQRRKFSLPRRSTNGAHSGMFQNSMLGGVDGSSSHSIANGDLPSLGNIKEPDIVHRSGRKMRERRSSRRESISSSPDLIRSNNKADASLSLASEVLSASVEGRSYVNTLQIQTISDGYNSGRTYYMRAPTEILCESIAEQLSKTVVKAKKRAQTRTQLMKLQKKTRRLYCSLFFQGTIGIFITMVI